MGLLRRFVQRRARANVCAAGLTRRRLTFPIIANRISPIEECRMRRRSGYRAAFARLAGWACAAVLGGSASMGVAAPKSTARPPVVAGYEALHSSGKVGSAEQGEVLLGELNCIACHSAGDGTRVSAKRGPDLSEVG